MKHKLKLILLVMMLSTLVPSAVIGAQSEVEKEVEKYIEIGLSNNLALKQQEFSLARSMQALKEARGMFLPSLSIEARHTWAGGGRMIEMPIGDMVNPIHHTLNQLLAAHGAQPVYPANIPNQNIPFLRETEQETKLRVVQPVFQPGIYYNYKIKKDLSTIEKAKLAVYKRQLVSDIKTAFFNHLKTVKVKELLDNTRELLEENLKLNQSLFKNHKRTEEVVLRAKAELSQLDQQRAEAEKNIRLSASYLNFLLNRPLDTAIESLEEEIIPEFQEYRIESLANHALTHRGEFHQLRGAIAAAGHSIGLHKAAKLPTINAVFDYGFQGEKYRFTGKDDYWMGSLVLSWNLYRGGQDKAKQQQARLQQKQLEAQQAELANQIRLQVKEVFHNLEVAKKTVLATKDMLDSRKEAFHIVDKKYKQDMVPQIEYMKARNDFTSAGIQHIIAVYDFFIKEAELERASALYQFN